MTDHLARALEDPRWAGWGYIRERQIALDDSDPDLPPEPEIVARTDEWIASLNLDYEAYFAWADSKAGRLFADTVFGASPETPWEERIEAARRELLTPETTYREWLGDREGPKTPSDYVVPIPVLVKPWAGPSTRRRRDILTALLEQPEGVTFPRILLELPMWTAWRSHVVYRELTRLEADGHAVRSDDGLWSTNEERVVRFNRQEKA